MHFVLKFSVPQAPDVDLLKKIFCLFFLIFFWGGGGKGGGVETDHSWSVLDIITQGSCHYQRLHPPESVVAKTYMKP